MPVERGGGVCHNIDGQIEYNLKSQWRESESACNFLKDRQAEVFIHSHKFSMELQGEAGNSWKDKITITWLLTVYKAC
jgi:hypothetical protein